MELQEIPLPFDRKSKLINRSPYFVILSVIIFPIFDFFPLCYSQESQSKTNGIIIQTTKDIQRLTAIVKRGDKKQKLHVDKLTTNFKEVIQMYSTIQKVI